MMEFGLIGRSHLSQSVASLFFVIGVRRPSDFSSLLHFRRPAATSFFLPWPPLIIGGGGAHRQRMAQNCKISEFGEIFRVYREISRWKNAVRS